MKAITVIGTRPEIIKMAPLIPLLDKKYDHTFLFTSQHYSRNMVEIFLDEMDVRPPDEFMNVNASEHADLQKAIKGPLEKLDPDLVIVYGDTNSTVATARVMPDGAKLCHIEAGIRSFDMRMPEEHNRIETDRLADFRLAPTGLAKYFLTDFEAYPEKSIGVVGNLVVDAYLRHKDRILAQVLPEGLAKHDYCLLTMHRAENVDDPVRLSAILESLGKIGKRIVFPVHPRTEKRMREFGKTWPDNLYTTEPIGYFPFMRLMASCDVVLTDSGGVQEEAVTLGAPCVTIRDNTERMETVFLGSNVLYDADHRRDLDEIVIGMSAKREMIKSLKNPYGEGDSARRIIDFLDHNLEG